MLASFEGGAAEDDAKEADDEPNNPGFTFCFKISL
jgi:hypothetical protein